jgi:transcriptional regulator with XRE-family HTH domain
MQQDHRPDGGRDLTGMSIGERIRYWRERRGIHQAALAGRVARSKSWLCQIENGTRPLDSFSAILDLARELRVKPWDLTGHRGDLAPDGVAALHPAIPGIRHALDLLPSAAADVLLDLPQLAQRVKDVWGRWFNDPAHFDATGQLIPELLRDAQTAVLLADTAEQRREAQRQLTHVYFLVRMFTKRVGCLGDSLRAADRAIAAAHDSGDPAAVGAALWGLAVVHSSMGEIEQADQVARQGADFLEPGLPDAGSAHLAMYGQLHLIRAVVNARMKNKRVVWESIDTAHRAAGRTGERNDFWTAFGPTNVQIHAVNATIDLGEPDEALRIARDTDPSVSPSVERRFSYESDIASIYAQRREDESCLFSLLRAEEISPHNARYSISVREMTRFLLQREHRITHKSELRRLAHRVGVLSM